jgi:hypothetical protein
MIWHGFSCCRPRESGDPVSQSACCNVGTSWLLSDYWVPAFAVTTLSFA